MISMRLPADLERKLSATAQSSRVTKTELIRRALVRFFEKEEGRAAPFDLGKDLFGAAASGKGNLSRDYKELLRRSLGAKHAH